MKKLKQELDLLLDKEDNDIINKIENKDYVYPFNEINDKVSYLLSQGKLSYSEYIQMRDSYIERNPYLNYYEMTSISLGTAIEKLLLEKFPDCIKANKKNLKKLDSDFQKSSYDLWYDGIKIEVKANRASTENEDGTLASRSYSYEESKENHFNYHFQQLKPNLCDVFIWVGICTDKILYWVITSKELLEIGSKFSSQHRNGEEKKDGIFEGQVFMTEEDLKKFRVKKDKILSVIKEKCQK